MLGVASFEGGGRSISLQSALSIARELQRPSVSKRRFRAHPGRKLIEIHMAENDRGSRRLIAGQHQSAEQRVEKWVGARLPVLRRSLFYQPGRDRHRILEARCFESLIELLDFRRRGLGA
ncbi:MAG TPA: hypothetical protein VFK19_04715 [Sphingomicrobium sp.]|nr:hypothetical protein [Sphingomicrobium sp.]